MALAARADPTRILSWKHGEVGRTARAGRLSAGISTEHGNVTLRHTAATELMQNGAPLWEVAGFLGMSEKTLREIQAITTPTSCAALSRPAGRKPAKREKLAESMAEAVRRRTAYLTNAAYYRAQAELFRQIARHMSRAEDCEMALQVAERHIARAREMGAEEVIFRPGKT